MWIFDVDGCVVDALTGTSLRPGVVDVLDRLRSVQRTLVLWSAGGADYARRRAEEHGLGGYFGSYHGKGLRDAAGRYVPAGLREASQPAVFVDDLPEELPVGADVIAVAPYLAPNQHDRGFTVVAQRAALEH